MLRILRSAAACVSSVFARDRFEHEVDDELRFHLEMEIDKNVRAGLTPDRARREAVKAFGGMLQVKEDLRSLRGLDGLDVLCQDGRYALRSLRQSPGFTTVVILTLALGIGANTAIFSAVYGVLIKPLPYGSGERLVLLERSAPGLGLTSLSFSVAEIEDLRRQSRSLESVVEYHGMPFILLGHGEPERVQTGVVSANFFDVTGVTAHLGRTFRASDDEPSAEPVLLLSHEYWRGRHGADPDVVGRRFEMNDRAHRVIGVLPPLPSFPQPNDVYMPSSACPFRSDAAFVANRASRMMSVLARMQPGATLSEVERELDAIARTQSETHPLVYPEARGHELEAVLLKDELTRRARPTFLLLVVTAGFVLLIACANVANITLSRLLKRQPELALRSTIGASRGRILCQLMTESTILSVSSGALGLVLAFLGRDLLVGFASRLTPRAPEIALDGTVLGFAVGLSVLTGLVFGVLPGVLVGPRREERAAGNLRRAPTVRHFLVATEIAVSLVLLVGAGLMLRSVARLENVDPGYRPERVLSILLDLDWSRYDADSIRDFHRRVLDRLEAHPNVVRAGVGRTVPLVTGAAPSTSLVRLEGLRTRAQELDPTVDVHSVTESYFDAIGAPILLGRGFTERDGEEAPPVAILNVAAARSLCPTGDPIGRRLSGTDDVWHTIVGVVGDVRHYDLESPPAPAVYVPFAQGPLRVANLVVRSTRDPEELVSEIKSIVHGVDPYQAVAQIQTLEAARDESMAAPKLTTRLLSLFAAIALTISAFGLGGALVLVVSQRARELGIRLALGATPTNLRLLVLRQGLTMTLGGLALGVAVSLASTRLLRGLLFEIEPRDPVTLGAVLGVLLLITTAASFVAARRATAIDPLEALRAE